MNVVDTSDEELFNRYRELCFKYLEEANKAISILLSRYRLLLAGKMYRVLKNPALVQDGFSEICIKFIETPCPKRGTIKSSAKAYLLKTAYNQAIDIVKMQSARSRKEVDLESVEDKNLLPPPENVLRSVDRSVIDRAIDYLSAKYQPFARAYVDVHYQMLNNKDLRLVESVCILLDITETQYRHLQQYVKPLLKRAIMRVINDDQNISN